MKQKDKFVSFDGTNQNNIENEWISPMRSFRKKDKETNITNKPELYYVNPQKYSKLLSEFEMLEGITSDIFNEKDWIRFDRFLKRRGEK